MSESTTPTPEPMTREQFSDLAYDLAMQSGPDADDLVSACDALVAQATADARAEVEQLRAEVKRLRAALGIEVRRNVGSRTVPSGAPDSVVRSWAREHNIPVNPMGRVAPDVRVAYEAAWRAEQDGGDPC